MNTKEIQLWLHYHGFEPGPVDGDIGPLTVSATEKFQEAAGLVVDGIPGPRTQKELDQPFPIVRRPPGPPQKIVLPKRPTWMVLAQADLGTVEGIGKTNNPKVVKYFADAGFSGIKDDETAWCAAFVGAILHRAGLETGKTLAARGYERWGQRLLQPTYGAVGVKKRGNSSWQGHVGFVVGENENEIFLLGGNQANAVNIAAFPKKEFTAFRWPNEVPVIMTELPKTLAGAKKGVSEA